MKSAAQAVGTPQVRRKEEPEYEKKIKLIQNREGVRVPVAVREQYILDVIKQFQYLIMRIARHTHNVYGKINGDTLADWQHETLTTFCELLISDYVPIEYGGSATFAPYIKTKLFCSMRWHGQKQQRHDFRHVNIDFTAVELNMDSETAKDKSGTTIFYKEIRESIYASVAEASEEVLEELDDSIIQQKLARICVVAKNILEPEMLFIWQKYFFSEMTIAEIGAKLKMPANTCNAKLRRILKEARRLIFEELGRQTIQDALGK